MKDLNTVWSMSDLIGAGLAYTVMGILIVFLILVIIMMVIKAMALFSGEKKVKKTVVEAPVQSAPVQETPEKAAPAAAETDELELVAVITAAIAAMTGESTSDFVVRSYKKVPGSAWNKAGRMEVLDNRL